MAKTDQELAQEEINNRQYMYGGVGPISGYFTGERREIIRPESTQVVGLSGVDQFGNPEYLLETIPAEYGPVEYDPSYSPVRRGLSALGDVLYEAPSFFGLRGPDEQVEAMQGVGSSLRDALFGTAEYMSEQARAFASGGEYYDPETNRVVEANPLEVMVGGNPATGGGTVLASGMRAPRVRAFEQFGGNLEEARNRLNITEEGRQAWQKTRSGFKQERPEELREAAQKVADGEMTFEEYRALVQEVLPPEPLGQLMEVPTLEQIALSLDKNPQNTAGIIGLNIDIPDGTPASSRLDINAYENQGTWVNTIHEGGKSSGTVLGYGPTTVLNNVTFSSNPKQALEIAMGKSKTPIGRIDGTWENRDPKLVVEQVRSILDGTAPDAGDWVEVGMNPIRGSGFYNKGTFELVGDSEQILQVGPVVLAKRPTYIQPNDPRNMVMDRGQPRLDKSGNPVFFSGGGNTGTAVAAGSSIANAARLRRADEQGFGETLYHATAPREPIDAFAGDRLGLTYLTTDRDFANQWMGKGGARTRIEDRPELQAEFERGQRELEQKYMRDGTLSDVEGYYREYDRLRKSLESTGQSIYPVRTRVQNTFDPTVDIDVLDDLIRMKGSDPDATSLQTGLTDRDVYQSGNYILYETPKVIDFLKERGFDSMRLSEGMDQPMTTVAVFDPEKIRSINAEFNPDRMGSANILYSGGGNTGTGIAIASSLRNELERRLGGPIPEVDRDTTLLSRLGDIKRINEMNVEMSAPQLASFPIARAEDLIDRAYITGISDTSRSGLERVTAVDGVPVDSLQRGGFAFGMQPENVRRGRAFASAANATTGQINRARAAQALSGRPGVLFIPHGMGGTSPDFATMSTDIAIPYAQNVLSRSDKRDLDRRIREGAGKRSGENAPIPNWVGIDNATPEYLSSLGGERKQVLKALDEKEAQAAGALSRGQVRAIVTEPSEFNAPFGQVNAFYELDPRYYRENNPLIPGLSDHPSYARVLSGSPIGLARQGFSIFDLNPSIFGVDGREAVDFMEELALRRRGAQQRLDDALAGQGNVGKARTALAGYDFPGLYGDGGFGTSIQGMLRAGGQGVITQAEVDDLLRRGLIID